MNASHNPKVQGFHKRMVGFKALTEENLGSIKRTKYVLFYQKNIRILHELYDVNMGTICHTTNV
jgi:hypothetical protein